MLCDDLDGLDEGMGETHKREGIFLKLLVHSLCCTEEITRTLYINFTPIIKFKN